MEGFKCQALAFGMGETCLQETRFAFQDSTQVSVYRGHSSMSPLDKCEIRGVVRLLQRDGASLREANSDHKLEHPPCHHHHQPTVKLAAS